MQSDCAKTRIWHPVQGLPTDKMSTDNAILVTQSRRWPLLIDPQLQGEKWLLGKEAFEGVQTLRMTEEHFLRRLEQSINLGTAALIQDVQESLDCSLDPLLKQEVQQKDGRQVIQIGSMDVEYNPNFQLYLTTRMANPHYLPEVFIRVSVINFVTTTDCLYEQLLAETVRHERPELEQQRDDIVVNLAKFRQQLTDLEDKMLSLLSESQGNLLDDAELISTLDSSRVTSAAIKQRVAASETTERSLNAERAKFAALPERACILYFERTRLAALDPMYQYSLAGFKQIFWHCLKAAAPAADAKVRFHFGLMKSSAFVASVSCAIQYLDIAAHSMSHS
jgi:dynein heavy chain, axonemal